MKLTTKLLYALRASVERLLMELGPDFYLGGRQQKMIIDGQIHTVDLEFYHRGLQCIVILNGSDGEAFRLYGQGKKESRRFHRNPFGTRKAFVRVVWNDASR